MKIGIDIDEVMVQTIVGLLEYIKNKRNADFSFEEVTDYHLWNTKIHETKEESVYEFEEYMKSSLFENPLFVDGAKEAVIKLNEKYRIYFITARPLIFQNKTIDFFERHFPNNNFEFIFSGGVHEGKSKGEICKELGIDIMIEDNHAYLLGCVEKGVKGFLLEKPWNKEREEHERIICVKDWNELLEKIKRFENE